jgi:hypothetical protein
MNDTLIKIFVCTHLLKLKRLNASSEKHTSTVWSFHLQRLHWCFVTSCEDSTSFKNEFNRYTDAIVNESNVPCSKTVEFFGFYDN